MSSVEGYAALFGAKAVVLAVLGELAGGETSSVLAGSNVRPGRRLGISIHTAKFHVAAILAKLDADSRTEAVARAAHLGLLML
jgi:DNA-binding NarL/FixJ family response regulator